MIPQLWHCSDCARCSFQKDPLGTGGAEEGPIGWKSPWGSPPLLPVRTLGRDPQHPSLRILQRSQYWSFCGLPSVLQMEGFFFFFETICFKGDPWLLRLVTEGGFPRGSNNKEFACNAGDPGLIPVSGRSPEGTGSPLQYSGLEHSMDCIVHGVTKSWTQFSNFHKRYY